MPLEPLDSIVVTPCGVLVPRNAGSTYSLHLSKMGFPKGLIIRHRIRAYVEAEGIAK